MDEVFRSVRYGGESRNAREAFLGKYYPEAPNHILEKGASGNFTAPQVAIAVLVALLEDGCMLEFISPRGERVR